MKSLVVFLVLLVINGCSTQVVQDAKDLTTYLFTTNTYDFRVRPVANLSQPIDVYITLNLMKIISFDVVAEVLHATTFLYLTWNDTQLLWTPSDYGGLQTTNYPQGEVWKPDMALKNSQSGLSGFGHAEQNVIVHYNGMVEWQPFVILDATCSVNIRYFPFDDQACSLIFVAYSYLPTEVLLHTLEGGVNLETYETNPEWTILSTSHVVITNDDSTSIEFTIRLKRKPLYTVLSIILPVVMLVILNLCVFLVPTDGGEKSGYSVTIFLSFAVFLTIVQASMPPISDNMPLFTIYIVLMTTMSTVITILAQLMIRCATWNEEKTKIPKWLITVSQLGKLKCCKPTCCRGSETEVETLKEKPDDDRATPKAYKDNNNEAEKIHTWKKVMDGLDAFLLIVFGIFSLLTTIIFLAVSAASE